MPKMSVKENKNIYFRRREELGLTRETASQLLDVIPAERIEKIENEKSIAHPDEVLIMAEKYGSPELCNYYCSHECAIGCKTVPEIKTKDLSQIILETIASLNQMNKKQERFIDIGADGQISDDEIDDFIAIQQELEKISISVQTLQLWADKMICSGKINGKIYKEKKLNK